METMAWAFGASWIHLGMTALVRVGNLEKKLKQFDVIPRDFDSGKDQKDAEPE